MDDNGTSGERRGRGRPKGPPGLTPEAIEEAGVINEWLTLPNVLLHDKLNMLKREDAEKRVLRMFVLGGMRYCCFYCHDDSEERSAYAFTGHCRSSPHLKAEADYVYHM